MPSTPDPLDDVDPPAKRDEQPSKDTTAKTTGNAYGTAAAGGDGTPRETLAQRTRRVQREQPLQWRGFVVIGGLVLVVLLVVIVMATQRGDTAAPIPVQAKPQMTMASDVDAKFATFMANVKEAVPKQQSDINELRKRVDQIQDTVQKAMQTSAEKQSATEEKLSKQLSDLQRQIELASKGGAGGGGVAGDIDAFVKALRAQKQSSGLNLSEARLRLTQYLKNQGFEGESLAQLRDRYLDQLGYLYVGEVAEAPMSDEEIAGLPESLRPLARSLHEFNFQNASHEGLVLYREAESLKWLRTQLGEAVAKKLNEEDLKRTAFIARIRKENVKAEMEEMLPDLAARRDAAGIQPGDLFRTEAFVYESRKRWPDMTPGQQLSLVYALGGLRANPSGDLSAPKRKPTAEERDVLEGVVREATKMARSQGVSDQKTLLRRGADALTAKLADMRLTLSAPEQSQLVLNAVAAELRGDAALNAAPTAPAPVAEQTKAPAAPAEPTKPKVVRLGPLELRAEQAPQAAWLIAIAAADRLKVDLNTSDGAAAMAALWSASATSGKATWAAVAQRDETLRTFANLLVGTYQQVVGRAQEVAHQKPLIPGMNPEDAVYLQAVDLGSVLGGQASDDAELVRAAIERRRRALAQEKVDATRLPTAGQTGWDRYTATWTALGLAEPGMPMGRARQVMDLLARQMVERRVAHEQLTFTGLDPAMRDKIVRDLNDDLVVSLPVVLATRDDGRMPMDLLQRVVVSGQRRYDVAFIAEALLSARGVQAVVEKFATVIDSDDLIPHVYDAIATWIPDHINEVLEESKPEITDTSVGAVALETVNRLIDPLMQHIARSVLKENITARLKNQAGTLNNANLARALHWLSDRLATMSIEPMTVRRLDEVSQDLYAETLAVFNTPDETASPVSRAPNAPGKAGPTRPGGFDVKDEGLPGVPIGSRTEVLQGKRVRAIPRGSAMQVYLEIGVDIGIAKADANNKVQLRGRGGFFDPSGKWFTFPAVILQGAVKSNPGADRNMVELTNLAFTLPSGRTVEKEISGLVVDEIDGISGMIAQFDRNLDKIIPEAGALAVTEGVAEGLKATQQTTTVVVPGSTSQIQTTGSAVQAGAGHGLAAAADLISQYELNYLQAISPTTRTPNGQKLVAYFFSTVEFPELTDDEWLSLESLGGRDYDGF